MSHMGDRQHQSQSSEVLLPVEIITYLLSFIPRRKSSQPTFWACSLVSRAWYVASIAILYEHPYFDGQNFDLFVRTICPSINARVMPSPLAALVKKLDMSKLVHDSNRSLTARLLGRVKTNLEEFTAPQASFAINSLAALSKCKKLRVLDMAWVQASIPPTSFFQTIQGLEDLETLHYPRGPVGTWDHSQKIPWPGKLKALYLSGGIDDYFLRHHLVRVPETLEQLVITFCPQVSAHALRVALDVIGPQLDDLGILYPMGKLDSDDLDFIPFACPSLSRLRISVDYISERLFDTIPVGTGWCFLELACSNIAVHRVSLGPEKIFEAVMQGRLPDLRNVQVSPRLGWTSTPAWKQGMEDLAALLEKREEEDPLDIDAGVWIVGYLDPF